MDQEFADAIADVEGLLVQNKLLPLQTGCKAMRAVLDKSNELGKPPPVVTRKGPIRESVLPLLGGSEWLHAMGYRRCDGGDGIFRVGDDDARCWNDRFSLALETLVRAERRVYVERHGAVVSSSTTGLQTNIQEAERLHSVQTAAIQAWPVVS